MMILDHFKAIKRSDPTLDLSKTVVLPGTSKQTCYDVTDRQKRFHDLVFASFQEAKAKEKLLKHCTTCTSGIVLLSEQLAGALSEVENVAREVNSGVIVLNTGYGCSLFAGNNVRMFLNCLDVALKVNERSHVIRLGDFLEEYFSTGRTCRCMCGFSAIILSNEGKRSFYITKLILGCPGHETMFCRYQEYRELRQHLVAGSNENKSPVSEVNVLPVESCLKWLQSIECDSTDNGRKLQELGAIAVNSKYLNSLNFRQINNDLRALKILCLKEADLIAEAAMMLGHSISKMSALEVLVIKGKNNQLGFSEMHALFGGFSKALPLRELELSCFHIKREGLCKLRGSFQFFPSRIVLRLNYLGMDAKDVRNLIEGVSFPDLFLLLFSGNPLGHGIRLIRKYIAGFPKLRQLNLYDTGCSEEDVKYMQSTCMFDVCIMPGIEKVL
ncbi:hypothetical protein OS493_002719 [Desmophyllum pertusum]|uniref:Uncharacterized protein n=1 Tax=Desmophyllum pertusum TaxID=174260 RepID=A0A9W9YW68_9CNID|nr:hypothetical protein OS493_002719 [Desmophyllum pertusum]